MHNQTIRRTSALVGLLLGSGMAWPGSSNSALPAAIVTSVEAEIAESAGSGAIPRSWPRGFATRLDVSRDGVDDWLIDFGALGFVWWCGTGGCLQQLWVSHQGRHSLALKAHVLALDLRPGTDATIDIELHGVYCGLTGGSACPRAFIWNPASGQLDEAPNRSGETLIRGTVLAIVPLDERALPALLATARTEYAARCDAAGGDYEEAAMPIVSIPDIDGDGLRDWVLDESLISCVTGTPTFDSPLLRVILSNRGVAREQLAVPDAEYDIDVSTWPATMLIRPRREY